MAPMPTTTKMPTQRSSSLRVIMNSCSSEHQRGQDEIQCQDGERRGNHGARRRSRHAFGGRRRVVTLEDCDPRYRDAEHEALDYAVEDVFAEIDGCLHLR